jgi:hypothetical protein
MPALAASAATLRACRPGRQAGDTVAHQQAGQIGGAVETLKPLQRAAIREVPEQHDLEHRTRPLVAARNDSKKRPVKNGHRVTATR